MCLELIQSIDTQRQLWGKTMNFLKRFLTVLFFSLFILNAACTLRGDDMQKSRELIASGNTSDAIKLLEKRVYDAPNDYEAYFRLGTCYVKNENYRKASDAFQSATRMNPIYDVKIGQVYKNAGMAAFEDGDIEKADYLFGKSIQYQPHLSKEIALQLFSMGEATIRTNRNPIAAFKRAAKYDPDLQENICDAYFNQAQSYLGMKKAAYLEYSLRYCKKHEPEAAAFLCDYYFAAGEKAVGKERLNYFRKSASYGDKHLDSIKKALLADANRIENTASRAIFLRDFSDLLSEADILNASVAYFFAKTEGETSAAATPKAAVLESREWIKISDKPIGPRDTLVTIGTVADFEIKFGDHVVDKKGSVYLPSEEQYPHTQAGGIVYLKNVSPEPGTIFWWTYKKQ
jgi:Tfp pilus assembly protein PilF